MKWIFTLSLSFLFFTQTASADLTPSTQIVLSLGQTRFIKSPPQEKVFLSHGRSLSVQSKVDGINLKTKRTGTTLVTIGSRTFTIHVLAGSTAKAFRALKQLQAARLGWQVGVIDKQINITGQIHRFSDWEEIRHTAEGSPYLVNAAIDKDVQRHLLTQLEAFSHHNNLQMPRLQFGKPVIAFLPQALKKQKVIYSNWLEPFGLKIRWSQQLLTRKPIIKITAHFIEANSIFQKQMGLSWNSDSAVHLLPAQKFNGDLSAKIQWMQQKGHGRVLAEPSLTVESGGTGKLQIGGEIPIQLKTAESSRVEWKNYGLIMKLEPKSDQSETLRVKLNIEFSSLDLSLASDHAPALKTHRFQSQLQLNNKSSILVSDMTQTLRGLSRNQLPGLQSLPLLGELFKSRQFIEQKTEAFLFLSAQIIKSETLDANLQIKTLKEDYYGRKRHPSAKLSTH